MVEKGHYRLTPDAKTVAEKHITQMRKEADEKFGNARAVRQFFEAILPIQAERIAYLPDINQLSDEDLLTITKEDIEEAIKHETDMC